MKISLKWLNTYLDRAVDADEAQRLLTDQGFPLDGCEQVTLSGAGDSAADVMLDVEVTSNRPDCLSHVGLAREVAAGSGCTLNPPDCSLPADHGPDIDSITSVDNRDTALCPLYTARLIRGTKVGPSPGWLIDRLAAVGLRSVNNVVDVTNFVLLELGQPLHAFDMARLAGGRIVVRTAFKGEKFTAIDGSKHRLDGSMLVIADDKKPVAIAGVMGGLDSEVTDQTTDILLESAIFDPLSVRRTSRALKLSSDSSYRFERGVDPEGVDAASRRAAALILELAGGSLAKGVIRVGAQAPTPHQVTMRVARCNELLGLSLSVQQMVEHLGRLGLEPRVDADGGSIVCTIPTYRLDLHREVDVIEEVARLHGLDQIPVQEKIHIVARRIQPSVASRRVLGDVLVAHGYHETVTFSFVRTEHGTAFLSDSEEPVMIDDEGHKAEPMLRPSLLPSLLVCRKSNQDMGNAGVRLFETGSTWSRQGGQVIERGRLGMLCDAPEHEAVLRSIRGAIEELAGRLAGDAAVTFEPVADPRYAAAANVVLDAQVIGRVGQLSPQTQAAFDLQSPVVVAELEWSPLSDRYPPSRGVKTLPRYPGIERDLSVIVGEAVRWEQIERQVRDTQPALLESIAFLGTYRGKPISTGRKSVSLRMIFRDPNATLRHDQVDPQVAAVVDRLKTQLDAELRG